MSVRGSQINKQTKSYKKEENHRHRLSFQASQNANSHPLSPTRWTVREVAFAIFKRGRPLLDDGARRGRAHAVTRKEAAYDDDGAEKSILLYVLILILIPDSRVLYCFHACLPLLLLLLLLRLQHMISYSGQANSNILGKKERISPKMI